MSAEAVSVHSARLSQAGIGRQVLKEGAFVLVRVIGEKGNGKYEGSVAGVRVQLSSSKILKAGETFVATVGVRDGKIVVTPKLEGRGVTSEMTLTFSRADETSLAAFLENIGLPSDSLSLSILQQLKQMGLKIDAQFMSRIYNLSLRFKGKEKSASEILMILAEKGLKASDDEILELLEMLSGEKDFSDYSKEEPENQKKNENLINRINQKEGKWYLLPFEMVYSGGRLLGKGVIRLLFENEKHLSLMNIDAKYNSKNYLFSLLFEGKVCKEIRFNIFDSNGDFFDFENAAESLRTRFLKAGLELPKINYCAACDIEGSASGSEEFYSFGGQV